MILVRPPEPARDLAGGDAADPYLSDRGREQVARLAAVLGHESLSAVYSSPMRRAIETAAVLGAAVGLEPVTDDGLAEFDRGADYLHFEDVEGPNSPYNR